MIGSDIMYIGTGQIIVYCHHRFFQWVYPSPLFCINLRKRAGTGA